MVMGYVDNIFGMGGPSSTVQAPTIDQSGANFWLQGQDAGNRQSEAQAQQLAYRTATGQGPSLAGAQAQQAANQAMSNQNAMASSASGSGLASARRQAMMSNAATMQQLGGTAATARAQEELGAQQNLGQFAAQARQGDIASGSTMAGLATSQGQLQESQNQANQSAAAANQQANMQLISGLAGAAGGAAAADADLQEPGGPAHWTLREEPTFILAKNQRTGELRKVMTVPLTDHEMRQALAHHGAGPLGANDPRRQRTTFHDLTLGASDPAAWNNPNNQRGLAELDWGQMAGPGGTRPMTTIDTFRAQDPYGAPLMQPEPEQVPTQVVPGVGPVPIGNQHPGVAQRAGASARQAPAAQAATAGQRFGGAMSGFSAGLSGRPLVMAQQQPVAFSPWAGSPATDPYATLGPRGRGGPYAGSRASSGRGTRAR